MNNTYNSRIITKTDTYENWTAANPVLLNGELVAVTNYKYNDADDLGVLFKFGDGASNFNSLPFIDAEIIDAVYRLTELYSTDHTSIQSLDEQVQTLQTQMQNSVVVYVGSGTPSTEIGNDGDLYIDISSS